MSLENSYPLVSVIVPVYNAERTIQQCVDSVLYQSFKNFELLLIDDGSIDGSSKICDKYSLFDERVRVYHTDNHGVSCARNYGFSIARGEYIWFVDSDDFLSSNQSLGICMKVFAETHSDCLIMGYRVVDEQSSYYDMSACSNYSVDTVESNVALKALLLGHIFDVPWQCIAKSELIAHSSAFFPEGRQLGEDIAFLYKLLMMSNSVSFIKSELYSYRMCTSSLTKKITPEKQIDFYQTWMERTLDLECRYPEDEIAKIARCRFDLALASDRNIFSDELLQMKKSALNEISTISILKDILLFLGPRQLLRAFKSLIIN